MKFHSIDFKLWQFVDCFNEIYWIINFLIDQVDNASIKMNIFVSKIHDNHQNFNFISECHKVSNQNFKAFIQLQ